MSLVLLEGGAAVLALLVALEMRREQRPWQSVLLSAVTVLVLLSAMVLTWRGH
jgi:hypothetical protein